MSPVFAVLETIREYYDRLSEVMASSGAQAVTIQNGASDLIEALQSAYEVRWVWQGRGLFNGSIYRISYQLWG